MNHPCLDISESFEGRRTPAARCGGARRGVRGHQILRGAGKFWGLFYSGAHPPWGVGVPGGAVVGAEGTASDAGKCDMSQSQDAGALGAMTRRDRPGLPRGETASGKREMRHVAFVVS